MSGSKPRVLLVDDDARMLRAGKRLIERKLSVDVITANDAATAIGSLHAGPFDVIVVDWEMPDIDGGELIERLARLDSRLRFVIWTGSTDLRLIHAPHGAVVIEKTRSDDLLDVLENLLSPPRRSEIRGRVPSKSVSRKKMPGQD